MHFPSVLIGSPLLGYKRHPAVAALTCVIALVLAVSSAAEPPDQAPAIRTLAKLRESWVQDLRTKQLESILKFYAPQAAFLQPTGERITGAAELCTLFQNIMATFNSDLTLQSRNLEVSGNLAYDSGDFQESLTVVATGAKIASKGSYLIVFKRQSTGGWQIIQQVFTGVPPPGA
jgi:ketosteroid isomerase-like protein